MTRAILQSLLLLLSFNLEAAKIAGADISFTTLNNKQVRVNLIRYRLLNDPDTHQVKIGLSIGNYVGFKAARLISSSKQTAYCDTVNYYDSSSFETVKTDRFEVIFDLGTYQMDSLIKKYCTIRFFFSDSSRSEKLTTVNGNKKFYLEALLDYCLLANVEISPEFSNQPAFTAPCNLPHLYNCGFKEAIGNIDSFAFALVDGQDSSGKHLSYNNSLQGRFPLYPFCLPPGIVNCKPLPNAKPPRGFYFDELLGNMIFTPTVCNEIGIVVIRINLFKFDSNRTMQKLGYISREMSLKVIKAGQNNLLVSNPGSTFTICEGEKLCVVIKSSDAINLKDTQHITWDKTLPNASLTLKDTHSIEKEATLCWQTKSGDGRNAAYHFTVMTKTACCPQEIIVAKGFQIFVKPNPYKIKKEYSYIVCNKLILKAINSNNYNTIRWQVYDQSNTLIATKYKFTDTIQLLPPYSSLYFIKTTIDGLQFCYSTDTIVNTKFDGNYSKTIDTGICQSNTMIDLDNFDAYQNKNRQWFDEFNTPVSGGKFDLTGYHLPYSSYFIYKLTPNANCNIQDTFNLVIYDTTKKILPASDYCESNGPIDLFNIGFYKRNNGSWKSLPDSAVDTLGRIRFTKGLNTYLIQYLYDSSYCMNYEQMIIKTEKSFKIDFSQDKTSGPPPLSVQFTNKTSTTGLAYQWNFSDPLSNGNFTSFENPLHRFDSIGTYTITLCARGILCTDTLIKVNLITVKDKQIGIKPINTEYFKLYPNPSTGQLHVETIEHFQLTVTDAEGQVVLQSTDLKVLELPKGLFFLKFGMKNGTVIKKVVIY